MEPREGHDVFRVRPHRLQRPPRAQPIADGLCLEGLACVAWALRHLRWYGQPRTDGRAAGRQSRVLGGAYADTGGFTAGWSAGGTTRALFGSKSSAMNNWPVIRLAVRNCARRLRSTSIRKKVSAVLGSRLE